MRLGLLISLFVHGAAVAGLAILGWRASEPAPARPLAVAIRAVEVAPVEPPLRVREPRPEPLEAETWDVPPEEAPLEIEATPEPPRLDARAQPTRAVRLPRSLRPAPPSPSPPPPVTTARLEAPAPRVAPEPAGHLQPPRLIAALSPRASYPARARRMGLEGTVTLLLHVGTDGHVTRVEVAESSGHADLDRAAADAAARWRFEPARQGGRPVAYDIRAPVEFRLTDA